MVEYLRLLLLVKTGSGESIELTVDDIKELKELAAKPPLTQILKAIKQFGQLDLGLDNYSTLPLELALVDCTLPEAEEKEEPVRQPEPAPAAKKTPPKAPPPAPEPEVAQPEEKKAPEPEPKVEEPVAKEEPLPAENPEPATAASADTGRLEAGSAIEQLQTQWSKMINEAPEGMSKTPAAALLRSARPKEIKDDTIVLSFKYPLHKENMEKLDNQKTAEKIVSSFLGRSCKVRCVYEHENNHLVKAALNMGAQHDNGEES
ncbi:hypothetical protein ES703_45440 [subsurface metagenome]